ncbi:MAG: hypothetical protein R3B13_11030 [Polyangiaceae bacterium]
MSKLCSDGLSVILRCGCLALLSAACASSTAQHQDASVADVDIPQAPEVEPGEDDPPAPSSNQGPMSGDEADEVAHADSDPEPDWSGPMGGISSGSVGGPLCDQAADCCLKALATSSSSPSQMTKTCDTFRNAPAQACQALLDALRNSSLFPCP